MEYKFNFDNKEYKLNEENFIELLNDEESPIEGIDLETIINLLNGAKENAIFELAYYAEPCEECNFGDGEEKFFPFLEYQFYINTKKGNFVTSSISDNEGLSFNKLRRLGKVDTSYIGFIEICKNCGKFFISIEKVEE